jgi:hypothetical protein
MRAATCVVSNFVIYPRCVGDTCKVGYSLQKRACQDYPRIKLNSMKLTLPTVTTVSHSYKSALESFPGPVICCHLQRRVILA